MNQNTVLVLTDEADFARGLIGRWQQERALPAFVVMGSDFCDDDGTPRAGAARGPAGAGYDVAVLGPVQPARFAAVLAALAAVDRPAICAVPQVRALPRLRQEFARLVFVRLRDDAADLIVLLAGEILGRIAATVRLRRVEQAGAVDVREAAVGRLLLETRHDINNALTSVLGNAELLLLDATQYGDEVREQLETIHTHALRMHEIMQRLSSIEAELRFAEREGSAFPRRPALARASAHQ